MIRYSVRYAAIALMRRTFGLLAVTTMLAVQPAAAEDLADKLVGSWQVVSLKISYLGENTEQDVLGSNPIGRIIYSADRHFAAFVAEMTASDRRTRQTLLLSFVAWLPTLGRFASRATERSTQ
jgi:hypothetical protein